MISNNLEEMNGEMDKYLSETKSEEVTKMLNLYREIIKVQYEYMERIDISFNKSEADIDLLMRGGSFLLSEEPLAVNPSMMTEIMHEIARIMATHKPELSELSDKLKEINELKGESLNELLSRLGGLTPEMLGQYLNENAVEQQHGLSNDIITFVYFTALKPFYVYYARKAIAKNDFKLWSNRHCPVCAQKPFMARFRKQDNARLLECWLCHTRWIYPRLACPFCDNKDHYKMRYFYVEEDLKRRVNVCEKCKNYIKTVNDKDFEREAILSLENLFTVELDLVARREGYNPGEDLALLK